MKNFKTKCALAFSIFMLTASAIGQAANISEAKIISISNPLQNNGIRVGDMLSRTVVLEVQSPYQLSKQALPMKGSNRNSIELNQIAVSQSSTKNAIRYEIALRYQVFSAAFTPSVLQLPAENFALTGGQKALQIHIPAWRFWFSPLAPQGMTNAKENMHPQFKPTLLNVHAHQNSLIAFISTFVIGLLGLIYINADKRWLPFMNGAFAKAHRQLKKLPKNAAGEKQALVVMHQALNQVHGSNLFANELDAFLLKHPAFTKLKTDIEAFFEQSNQSLFAQSLSTEKNQNSTAFIANMVALSRRLRDSERGV